MTEEASILTAPIPQPQRRRVSTWHRVWHSLWRAKFPIVALFILGVVVIMAVFAPLLAPYSPNKVDVEIAFCRPPLQGAILRIRWEPIHWAETCFRA